VLFAVDTTSQRIIPMLHSVAKNLLTHRLTPLLLMLKASHDYSLANLQTEIEDVNQINIALILSGKRNILNSWSRICRAPFAEPNFSALRRTVFSWAKSMFSKAEGPMQVKLTDFQQLLRVGEQFIELIQRENVMVKRLTASILEKFSALVGAERSIQELVDELQKYEELLSRVSLCGMLYEKQLTEILDEKVAEGGNFESAWKFLEVKFPSEVVSDSAMMLRLNSVIQRLDRMAESLKFKTLKDATLNFLREFLDAEILDQSSRSKEDLLEMRFVKLWELIVQHSFNVKEIQSLLDAGYSSLLWKSSEKFCYPLKTFADSDSALKFKNSLIKNYHGYVDIIKEYRVSAVNVDGLSIPLTALFDESVQLEQLRSRRNLVIKLLDALGKRETDKYSDELVSRTRNTLGTLLKAENDLERDHAMQLKSTADKVERSWTAEIHTWRFFNTVQCFSESIEGCYSPVGSHTEKPLEIALRVNSQVWSVRDADNKTELENCEVLLTDQGALVYKAYTNGHKFDTSLVWSQVFVKVLQSGLFPALIIPFDHPNPKTFAILRRYVAGELASVLLSYRADWLDDFSSYYDSKPTKTVLDKDLVLTKDNIHQLALFLGMANAEDEKSLKSEALSPKLPSIKSKNLDLSGAIFQLVLKELRNAASLHIKSLNFLGREISRYISTLVETGASDAALLSVGFDVERWKQKFKSKDGDIPELKLNRDNSEIQKEIMDGLLEVIHHCTRSFVLQTDLEDLLINDRQQFFDLQKFLQLLVSRSSSFIPESVLRQRYAQVKEIQTRTTEVIPITSCSISVQEEIMRWIFRNEDRVWRFRGGRPGLETVNDFLRFTYGAPKGTAPFPGLIAVPSYCLVGKDYDASLLEIMKKDLIVAYCTGEYFCKQDRHKRFEQDTKLELDWVDNKFEFVAAWVDERFNGLNLAVEMYYEGMKLLKKTNPMCKTLLFEILAGSWDRITDKITGSKQVSHIAKSLRLDRAVLSNFHDSYSIRNTQTGFDEQFVLIEINLDLSLYILWLTHVLVKCSKRCFMKGSFNLSKAKKVKQD
jgi:hypothetical protein